MKNWPRIFIKLALLYKIILKQRKFEIPVLLSLHRFYNHMFKIMLDFSRCYKWYDRSYLTRFVILRMKYFDKIQFK